jgi:hypothetical protein
MVLKVAIFILALGLFLFMGMALLNVEAQRTQIGVLKEEIAKLQPGASPGVAGQPAAGAGRVITFDGTAPALFDPANAATPQAVPIPGPPAGEIQLAVVTVTGVEGAGGVVVPLSAPAILVQKGVAQEVRGGCSVDAPPTGAWVLSLQGAGLQVASRDCVARTGLRPLLKVTLLY